MIGQQFIIGISGEELTKDEEQFIVENSIGGVILFDRNLKSIEQIHQLITHIQQLRFKDPEKRPLFISIDMEGGRVHRLKEPFTQWPAVKNLGDLGSSSVAFEFTQSMGAELKAMGMNLDYAPCVDILVNPDNQVIGDRSLSTDWKKVASLSSAMVRGYTKSGVLSCAKHFPGHGYTTVDSHFDLPVDKRSLMDLEEQGDLEPFKRVIRTGVDMIMTAHIKYSHIDPQFPVTLSSLFIKEILRKALGYRGIIITDDLDMQALTKHFPTKELPLMALKAGATILLYCNKPSSPIQAIKRVQEALEKKELEPAVVEENHKLIEACKSQKLQYPVDPFSLEEAKAIIGQKKHLELAKTLNPPLPQGLREAPPKTRGEKCP